VATTEQAGDHTINRGGIAEKDRSDILTELIQNLNVHDGCHDIGRPSFEFQSGL
jgi:hypothetical protein